MDAALISFVGSPVADRDYVSSYFTWVHPWLPFLSRQRFLERVLNPLRPVRTGSMMLIAAMKLLANCPPQSTSEAAGYMSIKAGLLQAEVSGLLDFHIFQASVLISLYELGHAIYPSAYMTVGYCIRYGLALGVSKSIECGVQGEIDMVHLEEQRRGWWAILVLERYVNVQHACMYF